MPGHGSCETLFTNKLLAPTFMTERQAEEELETVSLKLSRSTVGLGSSPCEV